MNVTVDMLPERIRKRLVIVNDCWLWQGWANDNGYGYFQYQGRKLRVHRLVYEMLVGTLPPDLELDHLCRTRRCCSPLHLELVTHAENLRRASQAQTACRARGHDWTNPENVNVRANGFRYCTVCDRERSRKAHARRRSERAA